MTSTNQPKHLRIEDWPNADRQAFEAAFMPGDIFDDQCRPGANLSAGSRRKNQNSYGRWLGHLAVADPDALLIPPGERLSVDRMRRFVLELQDEVRVTTVASTVDGIYQTARLIAPAIDWSWLSGLKRRLHSQSEPLDRFGNLVMPDETLEIGISLMEAACNAAPRPHRLNEIQFRDGMIIALLTLWPIRRRSLAALTVNRHIEQSEGRINLLLFSEDTKGKRPEAIPLHPMLIQYFEHYLAKIRPILLGDRTSDALWVSQHGKSLTSDAIYGAVRRHLFKATGKMMGLHDFRRATGTYIAQTMPEKIGILPGLLQHRDPNTGQRHYNQARSENASRRFAEVQREMRSRYKAVQRKRSIDT